MTVKKNSYNLNLMIMKNCSKKTCKMENPQPLENFYLNPKSKDGLDSRCKNCKREYEDEYRRTHRDIIKVRAKEQRQKNPGYPKEWKEKNPEKFKANQKKSKKKNALKIKKKSAEYYQENKEHYSENGKVWRENNPEKEKARGKRYRKENKGVTNAKTAKRRAQKLNATPKWISEEQILEIKDIYKKSAQKTKETGIKHTVDHILPLQGENVCGLHVPWNLRVITNKENSAKNNNVLEEDLESHKKFVMDLINKKPQQE